jgi:hypothetical protein
MIVTPEEVGLSSPRLARIGEHVQRYIDSGKAAMTSRCEPPRCPTATPGRRAVSALDGSRAAADNVEDINIRLRR